MKLGSARRWRAIFSGSPKMAFNRFRKDGLTKKIRRAAEFHTRAACATGFSL
jgi:hypothetical protein